MFHLVLTAAFAIFCIVYLLPLLLLLLVAAIGFPLLWAATTLNDALVALGETIKSVGRLLLRMIPAKLQKLAKEAAKKLAKEAAEPCAPAITARPQYPEWLSLLAADIANGLAPAAAPGFITALDALMATNPNLGGLDKAFLLSMYRRDLGRARGNVRVTGAISRVIALLESASYGALPPEVPAESARVSAASAYWPCKEFFAQRDDLLTLLKLRTLRSAA